jgi:hypothetical protein
VSSGPGARRLRPRGAEAYSFAMERTARSVGPRWATAALLFALAAGLSCGEPTRPGLPGAAPAIAVSISPSQADVPFGYRATVQVTGDHLAPAMQVIMRGRWSSIPISGPGTYTLDDTLRTLTTDTLRFVVASESGGRDTATATVRGTNTPPSITEHFVSSDSVAIGDSALVRFVAIDTKPGFTTEIRLGNTVVARMATTLVDTAVLWAKPTSPGPQSAVVTVTDAYGATMRDSVSVRAFANPGALAITATGMRDWIARLSDDSLRGRGTPGPEIETAALAITARFQQLGLSGAFSGAFVQRFPWAGGSTAPNVGAVLFGGDPLLRSEFVVIVAHFDAVGATAQLPRFCAAMGADSICNGANDNASGTAAVLELAAAFAWRATRPSRSVLFLAVSGEEEGLVGSTFFADNPPIALANVVAVLNIDMIGRNSPSAIYVAGLDRSTLGDRAGAVAAAHAELGLQPTALAVSANSDHWPFFSRGIPALMFYNGSNAEYHRPTDTVDLIDADLAARTARLVYYTALDVLDAPTRPQWYAGGLPGPQ